MPDPTNSQIAQALDELGDLYELDGAVIHRIVAYRNAAKAVRDASESVAGLALAGRAVDLPGIGATIQEKVVALTETGEIPALVKLRAKYPPGLVAMTHLPGLGPKRARRLYDELGIDSLEALRTAAEGHRIRTLKGFGPKAEEALLVALASFETDGPARRTVLSRALAVGERLVEALRAHPAADRVELAGSARRMAESVKDLDIIATSSDPAALARAAAEMTLVESAKSLRDSVEGFVGDEAKSLRDSVKGFAGGESPGSNAVAARLLTHSGLQVDLRIVEPDQFGNLLQHLTGSKEHNMALRDYAVRRGLHISEYGLLDDATGETHRCATEQEVYALLGMAYIEPELRENRGEIEAAIRGALPRLVTVDDLRGDLHCHTTASDGTASVEQMARAARAAGYEYLCITDHSASMGFGAEVTDEQLRRQIELVRGTQVEGIELLIGSEVNVLPDGSLDYPDELLAELDWVIASVHTSFRMPAAEMTRRIVQAIEHPWVDCMGHLSGRKIERRPAYEFDFEAVLEAAVRTGTLFEINASPDRRDLNEVHARAAAAAGIPIVINCDAHRVGGFEVARYGVATARRAWLGPSQIANAGTWAQLRAQTKHGRAAGARQTS